MKYFQNFIITALVIATGITMNAQSGSYNGFTEDETILYTMNKQVGQFVKRFNMEEDQFGKDLSKTDKRYHSSELRENLLPGMFDKYNPRTSGTLKTYFIDDVTCNKN